MRGHENHVALVLAGGADDFFVGQERQRGMRLASDSGGLGGERNRVDCLLRQCLQLDAVDDGIDHHRALDRRQHRIRLGDRERHDERAGCLRIIDGGDDRLPGKGRPIGGNKNFFVHDRAPDNYVWEINATSTREWSCFSAPSG